MSNYSIISEKDKLFYIKEEATEHIIGKYNSRKEANKLFKKLKSGAVFNGWTPSFILKKVDIKFKEGIQK